MTRMPASRACLTDSVIALVSDAVIRMPFTPAAMQLSMACCWVSWSPSILPAKLISSMPSSSAFAVAPSFIFTKNGLMSVLVMMQALTGSCAAATPADRASTDAASDKQSEDLMIIPETPPNGGTSSALPYQEARSVSSCQ